MSKVGSGTVILRYDKTYNISTKQPILMWSGGIELHQMSIVEPTPEAFLKRAQEIFPGWNVQIAEWLRVDPSDEGAPDELSQSPESERPLGQGES